MNIKEITITVFRGENLSGTKAGDREFSCSMGVGSSKFLTSSIVSTKGSVLWNNFSVIPVKGSYKPIKIKLIDGKKRVAKISIPLTQIPAEKPSNFVEYSLIPYPKFPKAAGKLLLKVWASKTDEKTSKASIKNMGNKTGTEINALLTPQVLFVDPKVVKIAEETQIRISGRNLGSCCSDLVDVHFGEKSVVGHVTYKSDSLLTAVIPQNTLMVGKLEVTVFTKIGGKGSCIALVTVVSSQKISETLQITKSCATSNDKTTFEDLPEKVHSLQILARELGDKCLEYESCFMQIKEKFDELLGKVIQHCPQILEVFN